MLVTELRGGKASRMAAPQLHLEVSREDHSRTRLVEEQQRDLAPQSVRFKIDRFAVTANNVTYAVVGDMFGYWQFFPAEDGWGRVPAMGWGEVVESSHPEVGVGGRYYGWFPMSQSIDMKVSPVAGGLRDDGDHRLDHAPVYRLYNDTKADPFYQPGDDAEDRIALLRGLFLTAFLADDFFADNEYFGASRVVVLSASSKTAIGFAERASRRGLAEVVGVTSAANKEFVESLGAGSGRPWYDRVLSYDDIESLATDSDAVLIDMAGNGEVLERVHARLGERLRYSMTVGRSHHDSPPQPVPSNGPQPELFFAPTQVSKRTQDWGPEGFRDRTVKALGEFVESSRDWLAVRRLGGPDAAEKAWQDAFAGRIPPDCGYVVSLWPPPAR